MPRNTHYQTNLPAYGSLTRPITDAIPYSDLADFFLVWLKRTLPDYSQLNDPFNSDNPLSPKIGEIVQDETKKNEGRPKDRDWFEETMAKAFAEGRRILNEDGVGSVIFAHKTTEGWEALLSGMIQNSWTITRLLAARYRDARPPQVAGFGRPSPPAFTSSAGPAPRTRPSESGPKCYGNCPCG